MVESRKMVNDTCKTGQQDYGRASSLKSGWGQVPEHLLYAGHQHGPCKYKGEKDQGLFAEKVHSGGKFIQSPLHYTSGFQTTNYRTTLHKMTVL